MTQTSDGMLKGPTLPVARNQAMGWLIAGAVGLVFFIVGVLLLVFMGSQMGAGALFVGMITAMLPLPIYVGLALWLDRFEAEPPVLLALAFLWGATIAAMFAMIFNTLTSIIFFKMTGSQVGTSVFGASFAAPLFEEFSKGLALFILFFWKKDEFDDVIDGIVYAAMIGLGFALTENFLYYGRAFAQSGAGGVGVLFFVRGILSPFIHPLFTGMTGIGLGYAATLDRKNPMRIAAPIGGLMLAMFLHFTWNFSASMHPLALLVLYLLIFIPLLIGVAVVVYLSLRREKRIMAEALKGDIAAGLFSDDDLACLCSVRKRLAASMHAMQKGGIAGWRSRVMYHQMVTELAFHRHRVSRGITGKIPPAEQEQHYILLIQQCRGKCPP